MSALPQITMQDLGGLHNGDTEGTRARLLRGGSYKRQRVVVIIPAVAAIPPKVYLSHLNLGFAPNNGVVRVLAEGMEVGDAYSQAIAGILAHPELSKWEFILTIEADNTPPPDGVVKLIERLETTPWLSAVSGVYFTKGPVGVCQRWGDVNDPVTNFRPLPPPPPGQLGECCGIGMGFALWRLGMFKDERLRKPWFRTTQGKAGEGFATQDLYAWSDLRKYGYRCAVDGAVLVGHYDYTGQFGPPDMIW
jgi:hypothetical protein